MFATSLVAMVQILFILLILNVIVWGGLGIIVAAVRIKAKIAQARYNDIADDDQQWKI